MLSLRLTLLELAKIHRFTPDVYETLTRLAAERALSRPRVSLYHATGVLAMLLCGLAVIFFIAANWQTRDPVSMFVGLQAALLMTCLGAARYAHLQLILAVLGFLTAGALMAFFGQYYQSGSDPWQLFAIWAGLCLPLAFACRSDVLWTIWAIVAMTAISTWVQSYAGRNLRFRQEIFAAQSIAMVLGFALCVLLSRPLRRWTGTGDWSLNLGVLFAVVLTSSSGLWSLFATDKLLYLISFVLLAIAAGYFGRLAYDLRALSICLLGLNGLLIGGSIHIVNPMNSAVFSLLVVSGTILMTLFLTVTAIQLLNKMHNQEDPHD